MTYQAGNRFPEKISYGARGGPRSLTDVVVTESGNESRNGAWDQRLRSYQVGHNARLKSDFDAVFAHFIVCDGRLHTFPFKDWLDFKATVDQGMFTMLTATTFQMVKRYWRGAYFHDRIIRKPRSGTIHVAGGVVVSIDYATGIVTVSSGPPITWYGEFDVPCRYDDDLQEPSIVDKSGDEFVVAWQSIQIVEVRVP